MAVQFQTIDTTGLFYLSSKEQIHNEIFDPSRKWFSLGQNKLDGTYVAMPPQPAADLERGWWSAEYADEEGRFAFPPTITGTVLPQPAFILRITGDKKTGNCPADMDITLWDSANNIIRVDQVRDNAEVDYNHIINVPELAKVEIKILRNNLPNAEVRIVELRILLEDEYIHMLMDDPNRRVYCRVNINYLDPFKTYSVSVGADSTFRYANVNQLINKVEETSQKWFSLTNNKLDGTYSPMTGDLAIDGEVGWWSNSWSDDEGTFATPPQLTINLTPQPVVGFTMIGDRKTNNYPVDFDIKLYEGTNLIHTEEVRGNTKVNYANRFIFPNISKYVVIFYKVSIPGDQIRLVEVNSKFSETYMAGDLFMVDLLEEVGYLTSALPLGNISANEITVDIADSGNEFDITRATARYKGLLIRNRKITAEMGVELYPGYIKWYPFGTYYTVRWNVKNGDITAQVSGRDILELLRQDEFLDTQIYENKSLYYLFEEVLSSFPLLDLDYVIDEDLKNIILPYAWFPPDTYRACLSKLCNVCLANVFVTRDNVIQVTKPKTLRQIDYTFTDEYSIYERNYPTAFYSNINSIKMEGQSYKLSATKKTFTTDTTNSIKANTRAIYKIQSPEHPIYSLQIDQIVLPAGITVHSKKATSWGLLLDIENTTSNLIEFTIKDIDGVILEIDKKFEYTAKNNEDILLNGVQETSHTSELLQNVVYTQQFADDLLTELRRSPMNIELDTRGHVYINLLDSIKIMNQDNSGSPEYQLTKIKTLWDGGLESQIQARFI